MDTLPGPVAVCPACHQPLPQRPAGPDHRVEAEIAERSQRGALERLMQAGGPGCLLPASCLVALLLVGGLVALA
ncbi:MAG TPA: hypothetical protein VJ787_03255 [Thermoleophilia bacterium]|nr:hypothetical protein [Thermoleophilia bacterium]